MKKRFIVLIDFSKYAHNLLKYASEWATQAHADLLLVHQTNVAVPSLTDIESRKQIAQYTNEDALQKLKALAKELVPNDTKVTYLVSESHLQFILPKLFAEPFENLIFVGLKGTGLLKKIFLGSVALDAIENTDNIVVAMPKEIDTFSHKQIFVAVAEKHPFDILELNKFLKFIDRENTNITFFHLAKPNEETTGIKGQLQELSNLFGDKYNTDFAIYEGLNPFDDISKVINNKIDEMLIVQKGSRLLSDQFFRKFIINKLIYEGQTPLIVLP